MCIRRLERIRALQTKNKMAPGYDRNCRHLTPEEVKANLDAGKPYVIRLKVPMEGVTRFHDALLGDIEWKNEDVSPDPVLLKSDGFPSTMRSFTATNVVLRKGLPHAIQLMVVRIRLL